MKWWHGWRRYCKLPPLKVIAFDGFYEKVLKSDNRAGPIPEGSPIMRMHAHAFEIARLKEEEVTWDKIGYHSVLRFRDRLVRPEKRLRD